MKTFFTRLSFSFYLFLIISNFTVFSISPRSILLDPKIVLIKNVIKFKSKFNEEIKNNKTDIIDCSRNYSKSVINSINNYISALDVNNNITIFAMGSFARESATASSDLECIAMIDNENKKQSIKIINKLKNALVEAKIKLQDDKIITKTKYTLNEYIKNLFILHEGLGLILFSRPISRKQKDIQRIKWVNDTIQLFINEKTIDGYIEDHTDYLDLSILAKIKDWNDPSRFLTKNIFSFTSPLGRNVILEILLSLKLINMKYSSQFSTLDYKSDNDQNIFFKEILIKISEIHKRRRLLNNNDINYLLSFQRLHLIAKENFQNISNQDFDKEYIYLVKKLKNIAKKIRKHAKKITPTTKESKFMNILQIAKIWLNRHFLQKSS